MNTKEIKITPPEGFEIDRENSTFECIKFKPIKKKRWRDDEDACIEGYYISPVSIIKDVPLEDNYKNTKDNHNMFATEKQAKSALAMAQISQIMANDERFGGVVTEEEWEDGETKKHFIDRNRNYISISYCWGFYKFLAFHTEEQRDLFLEENKDLVRDYLML